MSKKINKKEPSERLKSPALERAQTGFFTSKTMIWICIAIAFIFYGNSIKNQYSLDDELVTTTDRQSNKLSELGIWGFGEIFTTQSFVDGKQNYEYRPVSIYSFAIEWTLFKNSKSRPQISHFINVSLYAVVGILLFQLLMILFQHKSSTLSAVIVILFMIHPIHSEVVNNIKNRDELLSLIFALLAAIQTFKWVDSKNIGRIVLAAVFIMLSLLSKKSNLPFIVSIPLMIYFFRELNLKLIGMSFLVFFIVKFSFNLIKNFWMNLDDSSIRTFNNFENPLFNSDFIDRIPMFFYSNLLYIEKLIFPYPLAYYYGYDAIPMIGFNNWQFYAGIIVVCVALYYAYKGFFSKSILSFGILFFFLAIGGVANLIAPMVGIFAERFAFSASIGFCIVLAYLFNLWRKDAFVSGRLNSQLIIPLLIVALPSLIYSFNRNTAWHSKKSLYLTDVGHVPNSAKANSMIATEYQLEAMAIQKNGNESFEILMQKVDSSLTFYEKSLSIFKDYESNLNNRGVILYTFYFDYINALKLFKHSIKVNPKYKEGMLNCANSYAKLAEGLLEIEKIVGVNDTLQNDLNLKSKFLNAYLSSELFKTLAITKQFDLNAREFSKKFQSNQLALQITSNAKNLSTLSSYLERTQFSQEMSDNVTKFIQTNPIGIINGISRYNGRILDEILASHNLNRANVRNVITQLKKSYIDSSKMHFLNTFKLSPKDKTVYSIEEKFALTLNDYKWLISIQERFIKDYPDEQHGTQYIQMGNAYLNLKMRDKALSYFQKGAQEFKNEKETLLKKANRTQTDEDRLNLLTKELQNLKVFKEKVEKGEI